LSRDLIILGYGAAGFAAMIKANELGIKPVMIGYGPIGGTCVNVGCVPSKRVLRLGEIAHYCNKFPISPFEDKEKIVRELRKRKYEDLISSYDVELIEGKAHFISPKAVKVNGKIIEGNKFIIATGSSPIVPDIKGLREVGYLTNTEALSPNKKIESLAIIGGRALAIEFAQMYKRLGVDVVMLQRSKVLIPNWEPEISLEVQRVLEDEGVIVFTNIAIKEVVKKGNSKVLITDKGEVEVDEILVATGRRPNTDLNLSAAHVELNDKGGVKVDEELRTTNPNIFAAGDVIGGEFMLEALAGKQGAIAAENAIRNSHKKIDMFSVPQAIFIQPNLARVGLTQREAEKFYRIDYRIVRMSEIAKAFILGDTRGLIKMIIDKESKTILGVHMIGENAAEVINEAALALRKRLTIDDIIDTVHVFPTMGESLKIVALSFYRDISKMSCCVD
jgi:mercuric reductase